MTNIEQEIIGSTKTPKGQEKIETITPEVIEVPDYDYGESQNTLDYDIALRNKPEPVIVDSNSGYKIVSSATVPYDVTVTGIGFKPKTVIINANPAVNGHAVFSNGSASDGSKGNCVYAHDNSNTIFSGTTYSTTKIISLEWQDSSGNYPDIEVELKSMNSDGFTLTVTRNDESNNFNFNYTCF